VRCHRDWHDNKASDQVADRDINQEIIKRCMKFLQGVFDECCNNDEVAANGDDGDNSR